MKKVFIMLLMPVAIIMGCSKDSSNDPVKEETCKVVKIQPYSSEVTFEYDHKKRVILIKEADGEERITYQDNNIIVKRYNEDGLHNTYEYQLDQSGRIIKLETSHRDGEAKFAMAYKYNGEGYLSNIDWTSESIKGMTLNYNNGNLIRSEWFSNQDYVYDTNENNYPYSFLYVNIFQEALEEYHGHVLYENGYFGKISKNRIISDGFTDFTYSKDSKGNINTVFDTNRNGEKRTRTILFECD